MTAFPETIYCDKELDVAQETSKTPFEVYQWVISQNKNYVLNPLGISNFENNHCQTFAHNLRKFMSF